MKQVFLAASSATISTTTIYGQVCGLAVWHTGEGNTRLLVPVPGTFRNLRVNIGDAPGAGETRVFALMKNNVAQTLTVSIGEAATTATDAVNEVSFSADDDVSLRCVTTGTPTDTLVTYSVEFEPDASGIAIGMFGTGAGTISGSSARYGVPPFNSGPRNTETTESESIQLRNPINATLNEFHAKLSSALPAGANTYTIQARADGADVTGAVVAITDGGQVNSVTGLSVDMTLGEKWDVEATPTNSPPNKLARWSIVYTPDVDGESLLSNATTNDTDASTTEYMWFAGSRQQLWTTTTTIRLMVSGPTSWVLRKMQVWLDVAPGAGNSIAFTAMNSTSALTSVVSIADTDVSGIDSVNEDTITDGMLLQMRHVPTSTPTVSANDPWWGAVQFIAVAAPPVGTPPGVYTVEVDKDDNGSFEEDLTSVTLSSPGVNVTIGSDVTQRLIPPRVSQATFSYKFPIISGVDRNDPVRIQGTFNSVTYGMFKGRIEDLSTDPNIDQQRTNIKALGFLAPAANLKGFSTQLYTDISIDTAIGHVLTELGLTGGERVLDAATRGNLEHWWLDSEDNVWSMLQRLTRTEGPNARLYEDGDGVVQFEAEDFRTTATRSTVLQETFRGATTEPVYTRMEPIEDASKRVINNVKLAQSIRAANNDDIVHVGNASVKVDASNTSITVPKPEWLADGDIMFATLSLRDNTGTNPSGVTGPTDTAWTLIGSGGSADSGDMVSYVYWKRGDATDAEVDDYDWTWSGASAGAIIFDGYRSSVGIGDPVEASQVDSNLDNDFTPTSTSITTLGANRRIITFLGTNKTTPNPIAPTGFSLRTNATASLTAPGAQISSHSADMTATAAGAVGALTWDLTSGSGVDNVITTVALVPRQSTVWSAGGDLVFGNDEVFKIVARASNPFTNAIVPVVSTDYTISAGALSGSLTLDRTSGQTVTINGTAGAAGVTFQGPTDNTEQGMTLRADELPITVRNEVTATTGDADRVLPAYTVWPHISRANMQDLADDIITYASTSKQIVRITIHGDRAADALTASLERLPSDRVRVLSTRGSVDVTGFVEEIRWHLGPGAGAPYLTTRLAIREV